jgi:hypothetical protein
MPRAAEWQSGSRSARSRCRTGWGPGAPYAADPQRSGGGYCSVVYRSRSSSFRTFPDTVIGKESRIRSALGIL